MHYITPEDRYQYTFINNLDDLISLDNEVRIIDLLIENILSENAKQITRMIQKGQSSLGRRAYSPVTLIKIFIYGYLNSITSSRKLEKECNRNIELIWLTGNLKPDFKTISDFRRDHGELIEYVYSKFRKFLKDKHYINGETIAIDGSKIKANTNRDMLNKEKLQKRIESIDQKIEEYLNIIRTNDLEQDVIEECTDYETGDKINHHLIEKVVKLQKQLEDYTTLNEQLENKDGNYISSSDKEANLMKSRDGSIPAYNIQIVVDSKNTMIASTKVSTQPTDYNLLEPMVEKVKSELQVEVGEVLGDKGYRNMEQIHSIEKSSNSKCYVPLIEKETEKSGIEFKYDEKVNEYKCSQGRRLKLKQRNKYKRGILADVYQGTDCSTCPVRPKCTKSKTGRIYHRYYNEEWRTNYRNRLKQFKAKEKIGMRKKIVEHPFGTLRYWMGKIPLKLRGKRKVSTELNLYSIAYNIRRLVSVSGIDQIMDEISEYKLKTT